MHFVFNFSSVVTGKFFIGDDMQFTSILFVIAVLFSIVFLRIVLKSDELRIKNVGDIYDY